MVGILVSLTSAVAAKGINFRAAKVSLAPVPTKNFPYLSAYFSRHNFVFIQKKYNFIFSNVKNKNFCLYEKPYNWPFMPYQWYFSLST